MLFRNQFASAEEAVEYLSRRRARALPAIVAMFALLQIDLSKQIAITGALDPERTISWLVLVIVLLVVLAGGGLEGLLHKSWRPFLNDELSRAHRLKAQAFGFWAVLAGGAALIIASIWVTISALQVLHGLASLGIAAAALRYAFLERRALKP